MPGARLALSACALLDPRRRRRPLPPLQRMVAPELSDESKRIMQRAWHQARRRPCSQGCAHCCPQGLIA